MDRLVEVRAVRHGHGLDVRLVEFLPDVRPEDRHKTRRDLGDVVDLDLEEDRIDVIPAGLERVKLGPSEASAIEEGLTVLEEVVRPGARVRGRRRNLRLGRNNELRRKGLPILRCDDADLARRDLRCGPPGHVEQERINPIRPRTDDRDLRALEPAVGEERLAVLELVALHLVPEESSLRQGPTIDGLHTCDFILRHLDDFRPAHAPHDRHAPVQARHQGRGLHPNLPVSGDDLSGRHLPPAESLHEDPHLARPDQVETFQDKRQDREQRERGPKCDCRNAADEVDHVFPLRP